MFSSSGSDSDKLIAAIKDSTQGVAPHMVFVIDIVSVRFGGKFTPQIKSQFERYPALQMLTLNDCGITSLQNFPHLPTLIRLDLVFNQIKGEDLYHIRGSRHLQTLMLGGNKIEKVEHIQHLKGMKQLLQLDLINNPVTAIPGYRNLAFNCLPTLMVLDTLDKGGKDAYTNTSMMQAVSRVPDTLFDKSPPPVFTAPIVPPHVHKAQKSKLTTALARTGSLDSADGKISRMKIRKPLDKPVDPPSRSASKLLGKGKGGKAKISTGVIGSRNKSSRAGLVFPVGRIKRHLKETQIGNRVSVGSSVYLAATLQYLTAELLQISGNQAKHEKKSRITPKIIKDSLKNDEELFKMFRNITIRMSDQ